MKRNTYLLISFVMLIVTGIQTAFPQKVIINLADKQTVKYDAS